MLPSVLMASLCPHGQVAVPVPAPLPAHNEGDAAVQEAEVVAALQDEEANASASVILTWA